MKQEKASLHEAEIAIAVPHLIEKSGHKSERHKSGHFSILISKFVAGPVLHSNFFAGTAFIACLKAVGEVVPPNKLCQLLLQGLACKNKKTRVVCIEEIQHVVESAGAGSLGRAGVKEIAAYLDSKVISL